MKSIFECTSYKEVVIDYIGEKSPRRKHGIIKSLAAALKCHPTYISQVLSQTSDFSVEQAVAFGIYFDFTAEESEFFLDLLQKDRAGTSSAKEHFQSKIDRKILRRAKLQGRINAMEISTKAQQDVYYETWLTQAVHMYCQTPANHTDEEIAKALHVSISKVSPICQRLLEQKMLIINNGFYRSIVENVYAPDVQETVNKIHSNWRFKTINHLISEEQHRVDTHYSSLLTISEESAAFIRELILQHLEKINVEVNRTSSDRLYALCLDFYRLA